MKRQGSRVFSLLVSIGTLSLSHSVEACIWDADTLRDERARSPKLAEVILGGAPVATDPAPLRKRIESLRANPREDDPGWWNDLAGAHLRLGEPQEAVKLLEPLITRFPDDYGIHANLGTAYHLLGHYQDAEREIARDLEINPEAHFGLEKYHLALLQYLIRDAEYQKKHVYVDEWSRLFQLSHSPEFLGRTDLNVLSASVEGLDYTPPAYRLKWNLALDPNFEKGVLYMASLNPREPACFVMLGIASATKHDYNLTVSAFEKAVALGSPQSEHLSKMTGGLREWIEKSHEHRRRPTGVLINTAISILVAWCVFRIVRHWRRSRGLAV